eukprot:TRINITY_DN23225_c0_g1_i1.p2 TRINITY_DN23225_c0_g1~~TRINITY_DN23225_c0_g1_i1.p2  ORF type:complete len:113 (+),score=32.82 TRINITY_DN23225_c0_g1_i1:754-1092(+)
MLQWRPILPREHNRGPSRDAIRTDETSTWKAHRTLHLAEKTAPKQQIVLQRATSLELWIEAVPESHKLPLFLRQEVSHLECAVLPVLCVDTCLLYTSPSPRDRTRSRMPSSA